MTFIALLISSTAALRLGNIIAGKLSQESYRKFLTCLLIGGSIKMSTSGCNAMESVIILISGLFIVVLVIIMLYFDSIRDLHCWNCSYFKAVTLNSQKSSYNRVQILSDDDKEEES